MSYDVESNKSFNQVASDFEALSQDASLARLAKEIEAKAKKMIDETR